MKKIEEMTMAEIKAELKKVDKLEKEVKELKGKKNKGDQEKIKKHLDGIMKILDLDVEETVQPAETVVIENEEPVEAEVIEDEADLSFLEEDEEDEGIKELFVETDDLDDLENNL